jgi:predicted component of type VI protein secretion system
MHLAIFCLTPAAQAETSAAVEVQATQWPIVTAFVKLHYSTYKIIYALPKQKLLMQEQLSEWIGLRI